MIIPFDARRRLALPGNEEETLLFAADHWIQTARKAIAAKGSFFVALSGGSTTKKIFLQFKESLLDWRSVYLFWSDERSVPLTDPASNYKMALDAGLSKLPIPKSHIFPMHAEKDIEKNALTYEETIRTTLQGAPFDLIMLGMGEDGHTASLFPGTEGVHVQDRWVVANKVPAQKTTRMTFTFPLINAAQQTVLYVLGKNKEHAVTDVLLDRENKLPAAQVGTPQHPALWILDDAACPLSLRGDPKRIE